jgi:hypothetical protein
MTIELTDDEALTLKLVLNEQIDKWRTFVPEVPSEADRARGWGIHYQERRLAIVRLMAGEMESVRSKLSSALKSPEEGECFARWLGI